MFNWITYLGYDICKREGIRPGHAKTEVIKNWPEPRTIKDIWAFIGLTSFFRRAIKNYSLMSSELNKLVRKNSGYIKGPLPEKARASYLILKQAFISKPCLAAEKRFIVTTDASATHHGSCLSQEGPDGIERPCGIPANSYPKRRRISHPDSENKQHYCTPYYTGDRT